MELEGTYPTGAEEWYCPICGRRFILQWKPIYNTIVLQTGDEYASHSGLTPDSSVGASRPEPAQASQPVEEQNLSVWADWLETVDRDAWWAKDLKEDC